MWMKQRVSMGRLSNVCVWFAYYSNLVSTIIYPENLYPENITSYILYSRRSYRHRKCRKDSRFKKSVCGPTVAKTDLCKWLLYCISLDLSEECSHIFYVWRLSLDVSSHSCILGGYLQYPEYPCIFPSFYLHCLFSVLYIWCHISGPNLHWEFHFPFLDLLL